jgi:DNA polymerase-3 subunit alpha
LTPRLPPVPAPSSREMLAWERETLGIFVSGHPLADAQDALVRSGATLVKDLQRLDDDASVTIAGIVTSVRRTLTKAGQQILIAQLEDTTGSTDVVVFSKLYAEVHDRFVTDAILIVKGRLRRRERPGAAPGEEPPIEVSVSANEVLPFVPPRPRTPHAWHVEVTSRDQIDRLAALISEWPGDVPLMMHANGRSQRVARTLAGDPRMRFELERIFGAAGVREGALEER